MPAWKVRLLLPYTGQVRSRTRYQLVAGADGVRAGEVAGPCGVVRGEWTAGAWRLVLPEGMSALRGDWRVKVRFAPAARKKGLRGIRLLLNGEVVKEDIAAGRTCRAIVPCDRVRPGVNTLEVRASHPDVFALLQVHNYGAVNEWFPVLASVRTGGPYCRCRGEPGLAALGVLAALGIAVSAGASRWSLSRLGVPVWTASQWARVSVPPCVVLLALSGWNLLSPEKLLFEQWSAAGLFFAYWAVAGAVCFWQNLVALRWPGCDREERERWRARRRVVVLFAAIWLAYNVNGARVGMIDCWPAPCAALSVIRHGDFDLNEYPELCRTDAVYKADGRYVSRWAPGSTLLCMPFFLAPAWLGVEAPSVAVDILAKLTASTITALSAVFLYLALLRITSTRGALWLTVAYALGTAAYSVSSQDTWQHGPAQLCLAVALWIVLSDRTHRAWHLGAGLCLGLLPVCRPPAVLFALPLCLYAARRHGWRTWLWYALGALPPVLFVLGHNYHYLGTIWFAGHRGLHATGWAAGPMPDAALALLVSPNRGVFVFSPFLLLCAWGLWRALRRTERRWREFAAASVLASVLFLLVMSSWKGWHAWLSYGSRYSADGAPLWVLLGGFGIRDLLERAPWRVAFVLLVAVSILLQSLGVFVPVADWNCLMEERYTSDPAAFGRAAWDLDNPQILYHLRRLLGWEGRAGVKSSGTLGVKSS
jgi:hypothetical protein